IGPDAQPPQVQTAKGVQVRQESVKEEGLSRHRLAAPFQGSGVRATGRGATPRLRPPAAAASHQKKRPSLLRALSLLEAQAGIEPTYMDLQCDSAVQPSSTGTGFHRGNCSTWTGINPRKTRRMSIFPHTPLGY